MRGAGCTINDMWDKDFDKKVNEEIHHQQLMKLRFKSLIKYFGTGGADGNATHRFRRNFSNAGTCLPRRAALSGSWGSFVSQLLQVSHRLHINHKDGIDPST